MYKDLFSMQLLINVHILAQTAIMAFLFCVGDFFCFFFILYRYILVFVEERADKATEQPHLLQLLSQSFAPPRCITLFAFFSRRILLDVIINYYYYYNLLIIGVVNRKRSNGAGPGLLFGINFALILTG